MTGSAHRKDVRAHIGRDDHAKLVEVCEVDGVEIAHFIEKLIVSEVRKRCDEALRLAARLNAVGIAATVAGEKSSERSERDYERDLVVALQSRGLLAKAQVQTGAGIADVVVYASERGKALGVIEVKRYLSGWRQAHHAQGQAGGYARSLGARRAWVTAPVINQQLLNGKAPYILAWDDAAETIHKQLGGVKLVSAVGDEIAANDQSPTD